MHYDAHMMRITAREAVELGDRFGLLSDMRMADAILREFTPLFYAVEPGWEKWVWYKLLGTIFYAGRIQGIREERAKRRAAAARRAGRD